MSLCTWEESNVHQFAILVELVRVRLLKCRRINVSVDAAGTAVALYGNDVWTPKATEPTEHLDTIGVRNTSCSTRINSRCDGHHAWLCAKRSAIIRRMCSLRGLSKLPRTRGFGCECSVEVRVYFQNYLGFVTVTNRIISFLQMSIKPFHDTVCGK